MATTSNANLQDEPNNPLAPRSHNTAPTARHGHDPDLLIHAIDLHTYYGASHILRGVDFSVARAETIGLMGRNGMGKSTLLKSIMGLVKPREGLVEIMASYASATVTMRTDMGILSPGRVFPSTSPYPLPSRRSW